MLPREGADRTPTGCPGQADMVPNLIDSSRPSTTNRCPNRLPTLPLRWQSQSNQPRRGDRALNSYVGVCIVLAVGPPGATAWPRQAGPLVRVQRLAEIVTVRPLDEVSVRATRDL